MKSSGKRLLSLLLAVVMLVSLYPAAALAEGNEEETVLPEETQEETLPVEEALAEEPAPSEEPVEDPEEPVPTETPEESVLSEEPVPTDALEDPVEEQEEEEFPLELGADGYIASGSCGKNLTWTLDSEGLLTISGSGAMTNWGSGNAPWYNNRSKIKAVTIGAGVNSIGDHAFYWCTGLTGELEIPDSVTSIGDHAFYWCTGLTGELEIPDSVTSIGETAFSSCSGLTSVKIGNRVTSIGDDAFYRCSGLTSVKIGTSVKNIGDYAFADCSGLSSITIPNSVTSIGEAAFGGCASLTGELEIPDSVTSIGDHTFYGCSGLTSITIPSGVTSIGNYAFQYCTSLTDVYYAGSESDRTKITIGSYNDELLNATWHYNWGGGFSTEETADGSLIITGYEGGLPDGLLELPPEIDGKPVVGIASEAFKGIKGLKRVIIPKSIMLIEDEAFMDCSDLLNVEFMGNVPISIGERAFHHCSKDFAMWHREGQEMADTVVVCGYPCYYKPDEFSYVYHSFSGSIGKDSVQTVPTFGRLSDSLFEGDASTFSPDLAFVSLCMTMASSCNEKGTEIEKDGSLLGYDSIGSTEYNKNRTDRFLRQALETAGFENDYYQYRYSDTTSEADDEAYGMAWKTLEDGSNLVAVVIRSNGYGGGWVSNAHVAGNGTFSEGFYQAAHAIVYGGSHSYKQYSDGGYEYNVGILDYLGLHGLEAANTKIWVTGYSRGGAVSNCIGGILQAETAFNSGNNNLFVYTFATPRTVNKNLAWSCPSVFNIVQEMDIVPQVPLQAWGFDRFGKSYGLPCKSTFGRNYGRVLIAAQNKFLSLMIRFGKNYSYYPFDGQEKFVDDLTEVLFTAIPSVQAYDGDMQKEIQAVARKYMANNGGDIDFLSIIKYFIGDEAFNDIVYLTENEADLSDIQYLKQAKKIVKELKDTPVANALKCVLGTLISEYAEYKVRSVFNHSEEFCFLKYFTDLKNGFDSKGLMQHWPEEYYAWLATGLSDSGVFNSKGYLRYCGKCPVDITVYDASGNIVAQVINEEITVADLAVSVSLTGEKTIHIPEDQNYRVETVSRESDATMDITVERCNFEGDLIRKDIYTEIPLTEGQEFNAAVATSGTPSITTDSGTLTPDLVLTQETVCSVGTTVRGDGFTAGAGTYPLGETVVLAAVANEGSVFYGWYDADGNLVTRDIGLHFTAMESVTYTAVFAKLPELSLDREYMAMSTAGGSETLTPVLNDDVWMEFLTWSVSDAEGTVSEEHPQSNDILSVDDSGTVTALHEGTAYVLATITYAEDGGEKTVSARCRVDVAEPDETAEPEDQEHPVAAQTTAVTQVEDKLTVELYSTDYTRFHILLENDRVSSLMAASAALLPEEELPQRADNGAAVTAARFTDETAARMFRLRVVDDRTLEVIPEYEYIAAVLSGAERVPSRVTSAVEVTVDGRTFTVSLNGAETKYNVTLKKSLPKPKAAKVTLNSYIAGGDVQNIAFTGAKVPETEASDLPDWLALEGGALRYTGAQYESHSGKITLMCHPEGWAVKVPVTVAVKAKPTAPKVRFTPASLTLLPGTCDTAETVCTVGPACFAEKEIAVSAIYEGKNAAADGVLSCTVNPEGGITVSSPKAPEDGKAHTYKVHVTLGGDGDYSFTVKVKAPAVPKLTVKASGAIEKNLDKSAVTLTAKLSGIHTGSGETYEITVIERTDSKKNVTDVTDAFFAVWNGNVCTLMLRDLNDERIASGCTYAVRMTAHCGNGVTAELAKPLKLNVKFTAPERLPVSVTVKQTGKIDVLRPETSVTLVPTVKNCYTHALSAEDVRITDKAGEDRTGLFTVEVKDGAYVIRVADSGSVLHTESYSAVVTAAGTAARPVKLKVTQGKAKVVQSVKEIILLANDRYSTGNVKVGCTDADVTGIDFGRTVLTGGNDGYSLLHLGNGEYAVGYKGSTFPLDSKGLKAVARGKTVTLKLQVFLIGNNTSKPNQTLTVKVKIA